MRACGYYDRNKRMMEEYEQGGKTLKQIGLEQNPPITKQEVHAVIRRMRKQLTAQ